MSETQHDVLSRPGVPAVHQSLCPVLWLVLLGLLTGGAQATQHLVSPGQDWARLIDRVRPGDEIILMPGPHRPASFQGLHGTAEEPIIIRGFSEEHPGLIAAQSFGLHLSRPKHVILQDLIVTGARGNGINIDDQAQNEGIGEPWVADLLIRRVKVQRTGPAGNTDGIKLSGLRNVRLQHCTIEGWGGSAIDMVGCQDVTIEASIFRGLREHAQSSGVQMKGGSARIRVLSCRFENAGLRAVNLGGSTDLRYFRPPVVIDAPVDSQFEAEDVTVEQSIIIGSDCAVAFVNARRATVRNNTIVNPRMWVFRVLQETRDPRFGPSEGGTIGGNLIVWEAEKLNELVNVGPNTRANAMRYEENIWWSPDIRPLQLDRLPGESLLPQVVIDPGLNADFMPTNPDSFGFGALELPDPATLNR